MAETSGRYLVHFEIHGADIPRLRTVVPRIHAALEKMSNKDYAQAYHSVNRDTFGYFIRTNLKAAQIRARLTTGLSAWEAERRGISQTDEHPVIAPQDKVLVVEIGHDFDASQFIDKVEPWLRHH